MRLTSWDHYRLDYARFVATGLAAAGGAGFLTLEAAGGVLGQEGPAVAALAGAAVFYSVLSLPKRILEAAALRQAREAAALAASASAAFAATKSKCRTLLALRSEDPEVDGAMRRIHRDLLLGVPPERACEAACGEIASDSARRAIETVARAHRGMPDDMGDESEGLARAAELADQSKLPLFMGAAFFSPIMLVLLAVLTHQTDPRSMLELVGLEVVVMDIAFYFSSAERGRLK